MYVRITYQIHNRYNSYLKTNIDDIYVRNIK